MTPPSRRLLSLAGAGLLGVAVAGSAVVLVVTTTSLQERSARFMGLAGMSAVVALGCALCGLLGAALVVLGGSWRWLAWIALVPWVLALQLDLATTVGLVRPEHATDGTSLSLVAQNLWYRNDDLDGAARQLLAVGAQVLVLSEFTPVAGEAFRRAGVAERYGYRWTVERPHGRGLAVFSTVPIGIPRDLGMSGPGVEVELQVRPDAVVQLFAVHVNAPSSIYDLPRWIGDMDELIARVGSAGPRTVVAGDLNATAGHRRFRTLTRVGELRDAHDVAGGGFVATWPVRRAWTPQLLRLDHVLVGPGLGIESFRLLGDLGSDHRGVQAVLRVPDGPA
ncbi:MAG: endonuclease/exonuclease/phosphatase family protein [Microthrixaceae bacterium]